MNSTRIFSMLVGHATLFALGGCSLLGLPSSPAATSAAPVAAAAADASQGGSTDKPTSALGTAPNEAAGAPSVVAPLKMRQLDLSVAGASFKGWTITGPDDATVENFIGKAEIKRQPSTKDDESLDYSVSFGKTDFADEKKSMQSSSLLQRYTMELPVDTASELSMKLVPKASGNPMYFVYLNLKVRGVDVACKTLVPINYERNVVFIKDSCKTLARK